MHMRIMSNAARSISLGSAQSTVLVTDKKGKPVTSFLSSRENEIDAAQFERFKREYNAYFASNEHVTNGPFALNWGSLPEPIATLHIKAEGNR